MRVGTVLQTRRARVVSIRMTETVMVAARLLRTENIGALLVKDCCATEGEVVLGVVSERDILQAVAEHGTAAFTMPVSALMKRTVLSCGPDDTVEHAVTLMDEHHVRYLPVFADGAAIGVISLRDVLALSKPRGATAGASAPTLAAV